MASDHTGDADEFYSVVSMLDGSDVMSATQLRTIYERIHDNTAHVKRIADVSVARLAVAMTTHPSASFADTLDSLIALPYRGNENHPGPAVLVKVGEAFAIFDQVVTAVGGVVPNLTTVTAGAVSFAGRMVVVGATTPFCAFRAPAGSWTAGGAEIGGTPSSLIYSPSYNGFIAGRSTNIYRSTDATAWSAVSVLVSGTVASIGVVGDGVGEGVLVVLATSSIPTVKTSNDDGVTWGFSGSGIPNRLTADEAGMIASCPAVFRNGLNQYVYHVSRNDSGARLRLARTADGITWESGPTLEAPSGHLFSSFPAIRICQTTGLMFIVAPAQRTAEATNVNVLYASLDWVQWTLGGIDGTSDVTAYAAANGRLFHSTTASIKMSVGIASEVFA